MRVPAQDRTTLKIPCLFENDDEAAAAMALGILNQIMAEATMRDAQTDALVRIKRFMNHERNKRSTK